MSSRQLEAFLLPPFTHEKAYNWVSLSSRFITLFLPRNFFAERKTGRNSNYGNDRSDSYQLWYRHPVILLLCVIFMDFHSLASTLFSFPFPKCRMKMIIFSFLSSNSSNFSSLQFFLSVTLIPFSLQIVYNMVEMIFFFFFFSLL